MGTAAGVRPGGVNSGGLEMLLVSWEGEMPGVQERGPEHEGREVAKEVPRLG